MQIRYVIVTVALLSLLLPQVASAGPWYFPHDKDNRWTDTYGEISTSLVFGDINGHGKREIVFGTKKGYIVAVNSNGKKPRAVKIGESIKADPILLDLKRNGTVDILACAKLSDYDKAAEKSIFAVIDGRTMAKRTEVTIPGSIVSKPAVADFDNDGYVDILISARGLFLIDGEGLTKNAPLDVYQFDINGTIFSSAVVDDLNGDGINDFIIPFTSKDKYYLQVFLSTSSDFSFEQVTLPLINELRVTPTLIKAEESKDAVSWRIAAPSFNKTVDFYTLTVGSDKTLSIKPDIIYSGLQYSFSNQLPAFCTRRTSPSDCFIYLNIEETGSIWKINAGDFSKLPVADGIKSCVNMPLYIGNAENAQHVPVILSQDNNTINAVKDGRIDKLAEFDAPVPQLNKLWLFPLTEGAKGQFALTGLTDDGRIFFTAAPGIKLTLRNPNVPDYFNQGVLPPPLMDSVLEELSNSLLSHNDDRADVLLSVAGELYHGDTYFRQTIKHFKQDIKRQAALLSNVAAVKRDIMEMVSDYDYTSLLQFVLNMDIEKKIDYVLKHDPEFLEEPGVADFYKKVQTMRSVINAFIPIATGIFVLTVIILVMFNYPLFIRIFYCIFFYWRENNKWKKDMAAHPAPGEITAYLNGQGLLVSPPNQKWDFSFRILLSRLVKRDEMEWLETLRLYETNVTGGGNLNNAEMRRFHRYILSLYKRLFYLRLARVSVVLWLGFQIKHVFQRDYYDIQTTDRSLCVLKFELARAFLNLNDFKPAFNYLHKFILTEGACRCNGDETMDFLNRLPDHKVESYFLNFEKHFFSRVPSLKDQISLLTTYRRKHLQHRVDILVDRRLKDCLDRRGFPMVVVADYSLTGLFRDHGMFVTLGAFNQAKQSEVILRCIPSKYKQLNIADDTGSNKLPVGFTMIQNVHRSQKWTVQVEPLLQSPSLRTLRKAGIAPQQVQEILSSILELLSEAQPLRFIPNLHPSHVFWENGKVRLAGNGLSKPHIDREFILNFRRHKASFASDWFVTPEYYKAPVPEELLAGEQMIEKTVVYYLGLLTYWMIEGKFPFSTVPAAGAAVTVSTLTEASTLINAALAPVQNRMRIFEFKNLLRDVRLG